MVSDSFGVKHWIQLIQAEYREVPGLNLTRPQMRRLWSLDEMVCDALVDALVASSVLKPSVRGPAAWGCGAAHQAGRHSHKVTRRVNVSAPAGPQGDSGGYARHVSVASYWRGGS
jgi:hypothetical protein